MPRRIPKACRKRGCAKTTTDKSGYCSDHNNEGWERHQAGRTAEQRGYGSRWRQLRKLALQRDSYLCQQCLKDGVVTSATDVDHIKAKAHGGNDELSNLQSLCKPCHRSKTARERHS